MIIQIVLSIFALCNSKNIGITHQEPADPLDEKNFAHATADSLLQVPYKKEDFTLSIVPPETLLWAPHVIKHDGKFWMFYCGGGPSHESYQIMMATSDNCFNWTRHDNSPLFIDGFDARDPMVLYVESHKTFVMYYTATSEVSGGHHVVAYRTSNDLVKWSERKFAYVDDSTGTYGGPTESSFVVQRNGFYYLFICCRDDYEGTEVFKSTDPLKFEYSQKVGQLKTHASEIIEVEGERKGETEYYISKCGWGKGGVYVAPLYWDD